MFSNLIFPLAIANRSINERGILSTSKTPYLTIDERTLGKKRPFVSVYCAVKYRIYKLCTMCRFAST